MGSPDNTPEDSAINIETKFPPLQEQPIPNISTKPLESLKKETLHAAQIEDKSDRSTLMHSLNKAQC